MDALSSTCPTVLIVAPEISYLTRFLPRLFAAAGARVVFAAPPGCSVAASRYVNEWLPFDPASRSTPADLENLVERLRPAWVVIVEERLVERLMQLPAGEAPRVRAHLRLPAEAASRAAFHGWAAAAGIAMPQGRVCRTAEEAAGLAREWGPVFLKRDGSSAGNGIRRAETGAEVGRAWQDLGGGSPGLLVQRALGGMVGVTDMVVSHGRLLAWVASEKWRTAGRFGSSVARRFCLPPGMAELAERVAARTGFHGLCGFDWVIDEADGLPKLIEFHPRPPSGFGLGRFAGVAFERAIAQVLGLEPETRQSPRPEVFQRKPVCCYFPDHPAMSLRQRDWAELRRWLPGSGSRSWSLLPWDDPALFVQMALRLGGRLSGRRKLQEAARNTSISSGCSSFTGLPCMLLEAAAWMASSSKCDLWMS